MTLDDFINHMTEQLAEFYDEQLLEIETLDEEHTGHTWYERWQAYSERKHPRN